MPRRRPLPPDLLAAACHTARLRKARPGGPIPAPIRVVATHLASVYGPGVTARALGVDRSELFGRRRERSSPKAATTSPVTFVELTPGGLAPEVAVEFEDGRGAKLRVRVPGGSVERLVGLFLGRSP
jgi:hypothetical protein